MKWAITCKNTIPINQIKPEKSTLNTELKIKKDPIIIGDNAVINVITL